MKKKSAPILFIAFVLAISGVVYVAVNIDSLLDLAGSFLVIEDQPEKCDMVFVPSGNPGPRLPKAIELFKSGLADKIVINLEKTSANQMAFQRRYGDRFSKRALVEHIIQVEGLDRSKVIIPTGTSSSTREDFELLKGITEKEKADSVIVTTSWYHLRRCQMVANRILGDKVRCYFVPASLPDKNDFISRPKRILALMIVYLKLAHYYVTTF